MVETVDFGQPHTAHDCAAVLYAIANMQERDGIQINFHDSGITENQIKTLVHLLANKAGKLQITDFGLRGYRLTLTSLQALEGAVRGDLLTKLVELSLAGSLTTDADTNAVWLTTFIEALLAHCPLLWNLSVFNNNLGVPGASAFARLLSKHCHHIPHDESSDDRLSYRNRGQRLPSILSKLDLCKTNLCDDGLSAFVYGLKSQCHLNKLNLADNCIHTSGVLCLVDAVCSGNIAMDDFSELDLSDNPIKLEGTVAVGKILNHCKLFVVNLSRCELMTAGGSLPNTHLLHQHVHVSVESVRDVGQQLSQMPQCNTITRLYLSGNSFTGDGIHVLAGFVHSCPCLTILGTNVCSITSDDLIWLVDKLNDLKSSSPSFLNRIEIWDLSFNKIDDGGVSAIIKNLHVSSLFTDREKFSIHFDYNPVSQEIVELLKDELERHTPVREF